MGRTERYFEQALGCAGILPMSVGFLLWVATVGGAGWLAADHHGETRNVYTAVAVMTAVAGFTAMIDFVWNARWVTPVTVAAGMFALLAGQSAWSEDRGDARRLALFIIQVVAVGIQFAAIANTPGRGPLGDDRQSRQEGSSLNVLLVGSGVRASLL
jgi:hypothetical protein